MRFWITFVLPIAIWGIFPVDLMAVDQQSITERIKSLSKVDRDRLDRNIEEFKSLPEDQKNQYRKLHNELALDHKEAGGLTSLLQSYCLWVQTLSPAQKEELQRETDSAKKFALVRRFKEEQEHPGESHEPNHEESFSQSAAKYPKKQFFDKRDLELLMKAIVDVLPSDLVKPEFQNPTLESYLPILKASIQFGGNDKEWPNDAVMLKMMSALNKETQKELSKAASKRDVIIRMTLAGILKQANDLVHYPTEEELITTTLALTPTERQSMMNLPPAQMRRAISKKYFDSKKDDSIVKLLSYRRQVIELFDRLGVEVPPSLNNRSPQSRDRPMRGKG